MMCYKRFYFFGTGGIRELNQKCTVRIKEINVFFNKNLRRFVVDLLIKRENLKL